MGRTEGPLDPNKIRELVYINVLETFLKKEIPKPRTGYTFVKKGESVTIELVFRSILKGGGDENKYPIKFNKPSVTILELGPGKEGAWTLLEVSKHPDAVSEIIGVEASSKGGKQISGFLVGFAKDLGIGDKLKMFSDGLEKRVPKLVKDYQGSVNVIVASSVGVAGREAFNENVIDAIYELLAPGGILVVHDGLTDLACDLEEAERIINELSKKGGVSEEERDALNRSVRDTLERREWYADISWLEKRFEGRFGVPEIVYQDNDVLSVQVGNNSYSLFERTAKGLIFNKETQE